MAENLPAPLHERMGLTQQQLDLVRRTVAADCNNDELELFLHTATRYGLDPLVGEIHAIKRPRYDTKRKQYVDQLTIQVGIDGYRNLAERTGCYCPGPAAVFEVKELGDKRDLCCTFTVLKLVPTGNGATKEWRPVQAQAWFSEYVQLTKDGKPNRMWRERPKGMLEKCAETLALRRAFPREMGGLRTHEEMAQADSSTVVEEEVLRMSMDGKTLDTSGTQYQGEPQGPMVPPEHGRTRDGQPRPAPTPAPPPRKYDDNGRAIQPTAQEAAGRAENGDPMQEDQAQPYSATEQQRRRLRAIMTAVESTGPKPRKLFKPDELAKLVEALSTCADAEAYDKLLDAACDEADQRRLGWKDQPADDDRGEEADQSHGAAPAAASAAPDDDDDDDLPF